MAGTGTLIGGRYRLGTEIGSGAMGVVWQASDERLHRTVALKQMLLPAGLSIKDTAAARARIMREGRIAARLQHPGTISIYDVIEHEAQPWLVMEYLPSRSLADWLAENGPLAPQDAALMGAAVAQALAAAHEAGVVHRDVKPGNILLGEDGSVKITDFGISRASGDVTLTATGVLAGTPAYLSPEMARGEPPAPASDVFSLGSTLYAAVEGSPPFAGRENQLAILHAVAAGEFAPPQQAGRMTALLMRLLRNDPAQRPTMAQAGHALAEVAEGRTVAEADLVPDERPGPDIPPQAGPYGPGAASSAATQTVAPQGDPSSAPTKYSRPATPSGSSGTSGAPGSLQSGSLPSASSQPGSAQGTPQSGASPSGTSPSGASPSGASASSQPGASQPGWAAMRPGSQSGGQAGPQYVSQLRPGQSGSYGDRQHPAQPRRVQPRTAAGNGPTLRSVLLTVLAVLVAAAIGIGIASLLMNTSNTSAAPVPVVHARTV